MIVKQKGDFEKAKSINDQPEFREPKPNLFSKYLIILAIFILGAAFGLFLAKFVFPNHFYNSQVELHNNNQANVDVGSNRFNFSGNNQLPVSKEAILTATTPSVKSTILPAITQEHKNYFAQLHDQLHHFKYSVFRCKNVLTNICAPNAAIRSENTKQHAKIDHFLENLSILSLTPNVNQNSTQNIVLVHNVQLFMERQRSTRISDICSSNPSCDRCVHHNADWLYSNGGFCNSTAEWEMIGFRPKK